MAEIHELSDILANQIAAGEVIERPASVVKELVENAIDANSQQIDILVEEAGVKSIRIIDDGDGIDADQVTKAFLRHATSKITSRNDLFRVHSLGFRGEALPSIASVADVVLETATAGVEQGKRVHYKGGELLEEIGTGARKGTDITVSDIFFNTPVRLKYLKSQSTELAQIVDVINRLALSYPEISFRLSHKGNEVMRTAGNGNLQQVIAAIYGVQQARKMQAIQAEDNDFGVSGYISLPELTRASRSYISVLINGRYIKNYNLTKALIKGYGSKLMVGRFPIAVLQITMDPLLVDVNVHPQKHEVRLSKESQLMALIEQAVKDRFVNENLIPSAYENYLGEEQNAAENNAAFIAQLNDASQSYVSSYTPESTPDHPIPMTPADYEKLADNFSVSDVTPVVVHNAEELQGTAVSEFANKYQDGADINPFDEGETAMVAEQKSLDLADDSIQAVDEHGQTFPKLDYIGQMHGTFLFAQSEEGLYLIDQHAAQERVKYEYYREEIGKVGLEMQKLLVPIVLNYPKIDILKIQSHEAELAQVGLHLEPFGDDVVIVREHPGWFEKGQEEDTIREMVDWVLREGSLTVTQFRERTAIMMACKRSIKANWSINDFEAKGLLDQLSHSENPYNCPHGRPVLVTFSTLDMQKMFKRIQDSHEPWIEYDNHPF